MKKIAIKYCNYPNACYLHFIKNNLIYTFFKKSTSIVILKSRSKTKKHITELKNEES